MAQAAIGAPCGRRFLEGELTCALATPPDTGTSPPKCINDQESEKNGDLSDASRLLGHTDKRITETVYRLVGEIVKPTR